MSRPGCVSFVTAAPFDGPPTGPIEAPGRLLAERVVGALRAAGLSASRPADKMFAWKFRCRDGRCGCDCLLSLAGDVNGGCLWLLACETGWPLPGWFQGPHTDRLLERIDRALSACDDLRCVRWHADPEWNGPDTPRASDNGTRPPDPV